MHRGKYSYNMTIESAELSRDDFKEVLEHQLGVVGLDSKVVGEFPDNHT